MKLKRLVGYVIFFGGDDTPGQPSGFDSGAFVPKGDSLIETVFAMQDARPEATICIRPVDTVPKWVSNC